MAKQRESGMRGTVSWLSVVCSVSLLGMSAASADEAPCSDFRWDASHEVAVMQQSAAPLSAATGVAAAPALQADKAYSVKLAAEGAVNFAATPAKAATAEAPQGGMVRFHTGAAGLYRVSLDTRHWIDVVSGGQFIHSRDFSGSHTCPRPHKIVEFDLPANQDLLIQISGAQEPVLLLAITRVAAPTG